LVDGHPSEATLLRWREGVDLNGEMTAPAHVRKERETPGDTDETWLCIILHEGRKRQIKRVAKQLGHPVKRLVRVRIGNIRLGTLQPGEWRWLTETEIADMKRETGSTKRETGSLTGTFIQ
jgi:pseudouridine synthase